MKMLISIADVFAMHVSVSAFHTDFSSARFSI